MSELKNKYNSLLKRIEKGTQYFRTDDFQQLSTDKQDYYIKEYKKVLFKLDTTVIELEEDGVEMDSYTILSGFKEG